MHRHRSPANSWLYIAPVFISCVLYIVPALLVFNIVGLASANPGRTSIQRIRGALYPDVYSHHLFMPIYEMPADLVRLALFAEDSDFFSHGGFHMGYILYAIRLNRNLGYRAYGASTITQQCARTLFLSPRKTYARKAAELLISLCIELAIPKDRILELYLNCAEFGPGIYGIAEAADFYYLKTPSTLEEEEMLRIISIMPNPLEFTPENFKHNALLKKRYDSLKRFSLRTFRRVPVLRSEIRKIESP